MPVSTFGPSGVDEAAAGPPQRTMWRHLEAHFPAPLVAAVAAYRDTQAAWLTARTELEAAFADLAVVVREDAAKLAAAVADGKPTPKPGQPAAEDRARRAVIACHQAREGAARAVWEYDSALDAAAPALVGPILDAVTAAADEYDRELHHARDALEAARRRVNRRIDSMTVLDSYTRSLGMSPRRLMGRPDPVRLEAGDMTQLRAAAERVRRDVATD